MEYNSLPKNNLSNFGDTVKGFISKRENVLNFFGALALVLVVWFVVTAPFGFPENSMFEVKEGESLRSISFKLKESKVVRSRVLFETLVIMQSGDRGVISGDYFLKDRASVFNVARRFARGDRQLTAIRVTIPEGFNVVEISELLRSKLSKFNEQNFLLEATSKEGYLFPDTYFFFHTDTEKEVLETISKNYDKKISLLREAIKNSGKTEEDIIIMASIIEKEAKGANDRETISGILWKRFRIGMPLQADAAPVTYEKKGLPDKPISNPGIFAIKASLNPKDSPYLYYLHDKEGNIYYARDYATHLANINKYLR